METPENPYQQASITATMRATVDHRRRALHQAHGKKRQKPNRGPSEEADKEKQRCPKMLKLRRAHPRYKKRRTKIDSRQKSQRQRTRPHRPRTSRRSAPTRSSSHAAPKLQRRRGSPPRICGAAIRLRTPPFRRPAAIGFRPSTKSARSMRVELTTPPSKPPPRTPCTQPAAPPETTVAAGCATARPAAEPSSTAPPPARRLPGIPAPSRVPAQAPPRRWPKEKVPPSCLKSRSVRESPFVTVVTPRCVVNRPSASRSGGAVENSPGWRPRQSGSPASDLCSMG